MAFSSRQHTEVRVTITATSLKPMSITNFRAMHYSTTKTTSLLLSRIIWGWRGPSTGQPTHQNLPVAFEDTSCLADLSLAGKSGAKMVDKKDKVRGVQNEDVLYGEREGWHLPEYDDSNWTMADLSKGIPDGQAGIGWLRTTFGLNMPDAYDVPLSFGFEEDRMPYRALLFVNGWLMGRRIANLDMLNVLFSKTIRRLLADRNSNSPYLKGCSTPEAKTLSHCPSGTWKIRRFRQSESLLLKES